MSILISPWSAGRVPFPKRSCGFGFNKYTLITPTGNFYEAGISELAAAGEGTLRAGRGVAGRAVRARRGAARRGRTLQAVLMTGGGRRGDARPAVVSQIITRNACVVLSGGVSKAQVTRLSSNSTTFGDSSFSGGGIALCAPDRLAGRCVRRALPPVRRLRASEGRTAMATDQSQATAPSVPFLVAVVELSSILRTLYSLKACPSVP
ncbi:hypothetical protein E2C01_048998 [Portunus trituberculatus]|uniref:Uncharacterized protein n=1 Tax=Portunus trituberculatus TaxID=210409 RepID=A0A5B7GC08_PORTR|nr:hypothetical protein [Portunus trituberculatus]